MPRDCIILGSGRSGTSLAAGLLAGNGYFMGEELWQPNIGNPTGYFEDREINEINEDLLAPFAPAEEQSGLLGRLRSSGYPLGHLQRWLSALPPGTPMTCSATVRRQMKALAARRPFCFKDPRFCYTLPLWRPYLGDAAILCVFRDPGVTAASIMTECVRAEYLKDVRMDLGRAFAVWEMMYRNVLEIHYPFGGEWLFVHYDQLLDGGAYERIERLLGAKVARNFAAADLRRSAAAGAVPRRTRKIYRRLCELAGYEAGD